nr:hypothetical protein [uncultured Fluviicola sp.]
MKQIPFSAKERLKIYELALGDWTGRSAYTNEGLCFYFLKKYGLVHDHPYVIIEANFPELWEQRPESNNEGGFWFEVESIRGRYLRRICLIAAIEEVKLKIENDEKK